MILSYKIRGKSAVAEREAREERTPCITTALRSSGVCRGARLAADAFASARGGRGPVCLLLCRRNAQYLVRRPGSGLLAIALSATLSTYFLFPPFSSLNVGSAGDLLRLSLFILVASLISSLQTRQQRAEEAERVQREYFQVTLASIGDAVIVASSTGVVTYMNGVAQAVTGWTQEEALGESLSDIFAIFNEETRQPVENPVSKVLREGNVVGLANHTFLRSKNGKEIPIDDSAAPIRDEAGQLRGIILVFRDISERRRTETALQESHNLLQAIVEGTTDAVSVKDQQGRYLMMNSAGAGWLGKSVEEVIGHTDQDVFAPESVSDILAPDRRVLSTGEPEAYEHTGAAAGVTRTYHSVKVPYRDQHGAIIGVIGIARDITERKGLEETLRQSEARYRAISDLVSDYAYAVRIEPEGRSVLEWVTEAFSRITGFSAQELEAREGIDWLIHPEDRPLVQQRLLELFSGQAGVSEHRIITKGGEVRWLRDYIGNLNEMCHRGGTKGRGLYE